MLYKKNDRLITTIDVLGINGEGIVKSTSPILFVPYALPKEKVEVQILKVLKNVMYAKLIKVIEPSAERVKPVCKVFEKCGGCQLQHLSYKEQLQFKTNMVAETLKKVGNIGFDVNSCTPSANQYEYRNKISLPVRKVNGELKIGFFTFNSHDIIEINSCPLQQEKTNRLIKLFKGFMTQYGIEAYDETSNSGLVKHLVAREGEDGLIVTVVINGNTMPNLNDLKTMLKNEFNNFGLYLNINTQNNNVILSEKSVFAGGEEYLVEEQNGITVKTASVSFMQVNNDIRNKIYSRIIEMINFKNPSTVIDAYSGAGLLTGILAKNTNAKVYGLEIVKEAIESADQMLKDNNLTNRVTNILGDCAVTLPKLMEEVNGDVSLVVDPPRKGLDRSIISGILKSKPSQIVYLACGLSALARDLGYLLNTKDLDETKNVLNPKPIYKIKSVTPYDMFPQTKHVETLVELVRIKE
ncbi:MAG: 23S rRNA (uracil(1939)-C(5))-methyltransferase RlmD [Spirochaetales bacterium]